MMLLPGPAPPVALRVGAERLGGEVLLGERLDQRLGGEHPRLDRHVDAGEVLRVAESRRVADQQRAVGVELGLRVESAGRDRLGSVAHQLRALQQPAHPGRRLELLRFQVRVAVGVLGVEQRHEAVGDQVVLHVVEPHAVEVAQDLGKQHAVDDAARDVLLGIDPPDLLDARLEGGRMRPGQVEAIDQLLRERAAHAFADHRHLREDVHAGLVVRLRLAVLVDAHVAGAHADHAPALDQQPVARESGVDVDARLLGALRQPLGGVGERHHVVTLLPEVRRHDRDVQLAHRMEEPEAGIGAHVLGGEALLLEIGDQLAQRLGIHARAREHVIADAGGLFQHQHRGRLDRGPAGGFGAPVVLGDLVHQVDGGRQRRRARADVEHVDLHALALSRAHRDPPRGRR